MGIEIHTLTPADLAQADRILLAAYGGPSRLKRLASYLALQPGGWIIARLDGAPAGMAGAIDYGQLAYIGLVGVDPAFQRRGVAMAMMRHLLAMLAARHNPVLLLDASPAGAPLYEKLGFTDDEQTVSFVRETAGVSPPRSGAVRPLVPADLPDVAAFDAPIFGAARAAVFDLLHAETPGRAFVAHAADGRLSGFLFAQADKIGPWAAHTPAAAEALLGAALELGYEAGPYASAPGGNQDAASLLRRYGFSANRALRHMRLGGAGPVGQRAQLYALASFALG